MQTTRLTLTNVHGSYSVELPRSDLAIDEMVDDLVKPVLLAAGFADKSIEDAFGRSPSEDAT